MKLNLEAKTKEQQRIKAYLEKKRLGYPCRKDQQRRAYRKGRQDTSKSQNVGRLYVLCKR